jgi:hypothetical protein
MAGDEGLRIASSGGPIGGGRERANVRWHLIRAALMRVLSVLWMLRALVAWAQILGVMPGTDFTTLPFKLQVLIAMSAVLHAIAAVGLWLAASWGAALWLLLSAGEACVLYLLPASRVTSLPILATTVACACLYAGLTYLARRESRRYVH